MKELKKILDYYPHWDIPVLPMKAQTRQLLFEQAIDLANNTGFVLPVTKGFVLAWKDSFETILFGRTSFRVWACCTASLTARDLSRLSATLTEYGVAFAAISGWMPFPECKGFLNTGASIHAVIKGLRQRNPHVENDNVKVHHLGGVPEHWIIKIVNHIGKSTWRDRHAKDFKLDPEKVKKRQSDWVETLLRGGDGFIVVVLNMNNDIGAYVVVPLDRSRHTFGGPIVAGINAIAGSIHEGRGFARIVIVESFRLTSSMWDAAIIQYQPENIPMARIVNRSFFNSSCIRYDIHWHDG